MYALLREHDCLAISPQGFVTLLISSAWVTDCFYTMKCHSLIKCTQKSTFNVNRRVYRYVFQTTVPFSSLGRASASQFKIIGFLRDDRYLDQRKVWFSYPLERTHVWKKTARALAQVNHIFIKNTLRILKAKNVLFNKLTK